MKSILFASLLFSSSLYAGNYQLEVAGIIPGVSTQSQVEIKKTDVGYIVGGYSLICADFYLERLLSDFTCFIGISNVTRDISAEKRGEKTRLIPNDEAYEKLLSGFTNKYKEAPEMTSEIVETGGGDKFTRRIATWNDSKGNKLILNSIGRNLGESWLLLRSSEFFAKEKAEQQSDLESRKF